MAISRLSRFEVKKQQKRLVFALAGSIGIVVLILLFGLKLLVGFSLLVDKIRGNTPQKEQQSILLPPVLDPQPEATNSASFTITGKGQPNTTIIVYLNESEAKKLTIAKDGVFSIDLTAIDGENTVSAKVIDEKGTLSDLSNVIRLTYKKSKPLLEVNKPDDNLSIVSDMSTVVVEGKTEQDNSITVNGHFVVIQKDGSFSYKIQLSEGENTLTIVATDQAGNQTTIERHITYSP